MQTTLRYLFLLVVCLPPLTAAGQQLPTIKQYTEQLTIINPAALSIDYKRYDQKRSAGVIYRASHSGIEDAPHTAHMRYDHIVENTSLMAFGGMVINDGAGATNQSGAYVRYAYFFQPSANNSLFIGGGMRVGAVYYSFDPEGLDFVPGDGPISGRKSQIVADAHLGLSVSFLPVRGISWYAGVSMPQAFGNEVNLSKDQDKETATFRIRRLRHYSAHGGVSFPIGEQGFMEPSFLVRTAPGLPVTADFNLRQRFRDYFWLGLGYATSKQVHGEAGVVLENLLNMDGTVFRISYGYDYSTAEFANFFGNAHELSINYAW